MKKLIKGMFVVLIFLSLLAAPQWIGMIQTSRHETERKSQAQKVKQKEFNLLKMKPVYQSLSKSDQEVYLYIYKNIQEFQKKITIENVSTKRVRKILELMPMDCPELFWCNFTGDLSWVSGQGRKRTAYQPDYVFTKQQAASYQTQLQKVLADYKTAAGTSSSYEMAYRIYNKFIYSITYEKNSSDNQNMISSLINKKSVCTGMAKGLQYLYQQTGVPCRLVYGKADGISHAWNLIYLDGVYCYVDPTWGQSNRNVSKGYFGMTTAQIEKTHVFDSAADLPVCKSMKNDYYVRTGLFFQKYDPTKIYEILCSYAKKTASQITLQFSDETSYKKAYEQMITEGQIAAMLKRVPGHQTRDHKITYYNNPELFILTINYSIQ